MKDAPRIWPTGTRLEGSPMLTSERLAWHMGYAAALDVALDVLPKPPDLASHSDVDLQASGMGRTVKGGAR